VCRFNPRGGYGFIVDAAAPDDESAQLFLNAASLAAPPRGAHAQASAAPSVLRAGAWVRFRAASRLVNGCVARARVPRRAPLFAMRLRVCVCVCALRSVVKLHAREVRLAEPGAAEAYARSGAAASSSGGGAMTKKKEKAAAAAPLLPALQEAAACAASRLRRAPTPPSRGDSGSPAAPAASSSSAQQHETRNNAAAPPPAGCQRGVVASSGARGFAWLAPADGGEHLFLHLSDLLPLNASSAAAAATTAPAKKAGAAAALMGCRKGFVEPAALPLGATLEYDVMPSRNGCVARVCVVALQLPAMRSCGSLRSLRV
jgi:hypothetical protein